MANLQTLDGISEAREELYNKLQSGEVNEVRAANMERILRGQQSLKADVPIRLLTVVTKMKGTAAEKWVAPLVKNLLTFTTGQKSIEG